MPVVCAVLVLCAGGAGAVAASVRTVRGEAPARPGNRPLLAVSCASARNCTAVGGLFAARWNGRRWSAQSIAVPPFSTAALDFLAGVSCPTNQVCMAVGLEYPPVGADAPYDYLALSEGRHGGSWTDDSPAPTQTFDGYLLAASCPSASHCVAVGQSVTSGLAMAWDGSGWANQLPPVASPATSVLNGVSCSSVGRCFAVGELTPNQSSFSHALVERWNGSRWSSVPTPRTSPFVPAVLNAVSCPGRSCTAVGTLGYGQLVERWNGQAWSREPTPSGAPDAVLNGVSCVSRTDCVAVGAVTGQPGQSLAERWNGSRWSIKPTPTVAGGAVLNAVSCVSAADCVAVGEHSRLPLLEHWNGTAWSIQART